MNDRRRLSEHRREHKFTIDPGASASFQLPETIGPVRVEVSFGLRDDRTKGGAQIPSAVMEALINQDPVSREMTWIGTNNDASSQPGTSLTDATIAVIFGGAPPTVNAKMEVADLATRTLKVTQSSAATSLPGHYVVRLWF